MEEKPYKKMTTDKKVNNNDGKFLAIQVGDNKQRQQGKEKKEVKCNYIYLVRIHRPTIIIST